jgi:ATP-dependent RNA helicase DDX19/DBP5
MSAPASLADRISKPVSAADTSASATPSAKKSWADEVASPTAGDSSNGIPAAQTDGATVEQGGGSELHDAQYEVEVKLSDIQSDTNSPLYSINSFEQLGMYVYRQVIGLCCANICCSNEQILKGTLAMNFKKPSKIQERALPLLLANPPVNMIAQSQSGTGKTAAFVITILSRLDYTKPTQPQALCLAPSRELARQIEGVVRSIGKFVEGLTIQAAVPGAVERGAAIQAMVVVGTPGTVMDLIKRRQFDPRGVKVMTLDEADNMLDQQGLGDQCLRVKQCVLKYKMRDIAR